MKLGHTSMLVIPVPFIKIRMFFKQGILITLFMIYRQEVINSFWGLIKQKHFFLSNEKPTKTKYGDYSLKEHNTIEYVGC